MTILLGRRHLYTHLVVGTETNREASGDASVLSPRRILLTR